MSLIDIDRLLISIFDALLAIEGSALKNGKFSDVTVKEMHTVEAVGLHGEKTAGEVARILGITLGTLTAAANSLIKKGYVERRRDASDRRIVNLSLTKRGRLLFRTHRQFHSKLVSQVTAGFDDKEAEILTSSLNKLNVFLKQGFSLNQLAGDG